MASIKFLISSLVAVLVFTGAVEKEGAVPSGGNSVSSDKIQTALSLGGSLYPYVESTRNVSNIIQQGVVSWYGEADEECLGCSPSRVTACGNKFREKEFSLASNHFSCGSIVEVCYLGRCVQATVTDTGGFHQYGRIADLSKSTFESLAALDEGIIEVTIYDKSY